MFTGSRRRTIIIAVLVFAAISAGLWIGPGNRLARSQLPASANVGSSVGSFAPDVEFTNLDGEEFRLSDFRGKVVMINLFASWCAPCILETPHLVEFYNENQDEMMIIGLNFGESLQAVETYRDNFQVNYPLALDPGSKIANIYKPRGLPTSWFMDSEGVVRYVHSGPMTVNFIQKIFQDIQAGQKGSS